MIPLEDTFADVLSKALTGAGWDDATAAAKASLPLAAVRNLRSGQFDEAAARQLAGALGLRVGALVRLGRKEYYPVVPAVENLVQITTAFADMTVNAYVLWDPDSLRAAIFDTGAEAEPLLDVVRQNNLEVAGIFLTHSHPDHTGALAALRRALGVEAWSSAHEPVSGTRLFHPGEVFNVGCHFIRTRHTPGHSPGGVTYVIEGRKRPAAVVGDALFAGSIGGVRRNYAETLKMIRHEILSLPEPTILCPGHGPMTTVAQEKENNPFF